MITHEFHVDAGTYSYSHYFTDDNLEVSDTVYGIELHRRDDDGNIELVFFAPFRTLNYYKQHLQTEGS